MWSGRFVRIQDRRLGLPYYGFLGAIVSYIIGIVILKNQGYLAHADADGVTRLQVRPLCCCGDALYGRPFTLSAPAAVVFGCVAACTKCHAALNHPAAAVLQSVRPVGHLYLL